MLYPIVILSITAVAVLAGNLMASPALAQGPPVPAMVRGANVSGGDFGDVPGTYGTEYTYPTKAEIEYYAARGFNVLRVPFRWERVQHELFSELDHVGDGTGDFERLQQVVQWTSDAGMIAVLDVHNYGGRIIDGTEAKVGSKALPAAALEDLWVRLARTFKSNRRVWFGLMNEPNGIAAADWKAMAQSVTNAIRETGALNRLLVPGTDYSGAHSWVSSGNAAQMAAFADPADNFAFDVHQYLDADSSGTHGDCVAGAGSSRLDPFIAWAKEAPGRRGFLSEFAGGDPAVPGQAQCAAELIALLNAAESSGVFDGWAAWGGGPWWEPDYIFRLEPPDFGGPDTNYMNLLKRHLN